MRGKKTFTIIMSVILLGIVLIGLLYLSQDPDLARPANNTQSNKEQEQKQEQELEEDHKESTKEEEKEKDSLPEEIKKTVVQVVEDAIGLFVKKDLQIVAIGDSLTQGVGDANENGGYVGIIENTLEENNKNTDIENYGKRGNRSDQLLKRLDKPEIATSIDEADIILVTIGANDIIKIVKENFSDLKYEQFVEAQVKYKERLRKIVDNMLENNEDAEIFLLGFYNPFENFFSKIEELGLIVENWNNTGKSIADEYEQVEFIPTIDLFRNAEEDVFYKDNFHPNNRGYQLMAERVIEYIRPSIERER